MNVKTQQNTYTIKDSELERKTYGTDPKQVRLPSGVASSVVQGKSTLWPKGLGSPTYKYQTCKHTTIYKFVREIG